MVETQRKLLYPVLGIVVIIGCITLIITLSILLTRRNQCFLGATEIRITGFEFEAVEEGIQVTWQKPPEMLECNPGYQVTYNTTLGKFSTTTNSESVIIPNNTFCYYFGIRVTPLTTLSSNSFGDAIYYETRNPEVDFFVESSPNSPPQLHVNWTDPNQEWCNLAYKVEHQSPDGNQQFNVTSPSARFNFVYCTMSTLKISPINLLDGSFFPVSMDIDATQYPETVEWPRRTNTTAWEDRRETWWDSVPPIGTCNISYQIVFTPDIGAEKTIENEEPWFEIHRSDFCYAVGVTVYAVVGRSVIQLLKFNPYWPVDMDNVSDLQLVLSEETNIMTATWTDDPLREACGLKYYVTIRNGNSGETHPITTPKIAFKLVHCVNTTVTVRTVFLGKISDGSTAIYPEVYPSTLEPAGNVVINTVDTTAFISWEVPESLQKCSELYSVTAINQGINAQTDCRGVTDCELSLSSFCPYTNFTIRPIPPMEGDAVEKGYSCSV